MTQTLDSIVAATRRRVADSKGNADLRDLERLAQLHTPRGFRQRLKEGSVSGISVIAELKKASPSRGLIRREFEPASLARELEAAGASALSVLTDEEFFQGSLQNLRVASENSTVPCLRKDFILDEFQILEARAYRADAILLIMAALTEMDLISLTRRSRELGLDVLCEAHNQDELHRALDAGCNLVGVNSRDLRTFKVDLNTALTLAAQIPRDVVGVAESGIHNSSDIANLRAAGYNAFLVGESLMKADSPAEALTTLLAEAKVSSS